MDKATKDEWIAELRSGKHKQIKNKLETWHGECCLGVFLNTIKYPKYRVGGSEYRFGKSDPKFYKTATLPDDVMEKYKILGDEFTIQFKDQYEFFKFKVIAFNHRLYHTIGIVTTHYFDQNPKTRLTSLNDENWSFEAIADVIEAFVEVDGE